MGQAKRNAVFGFQLLTLCVMFKLSDVRSQTHDRVLDATGCHDHIIQEMTSKLIRNSAPCRLAPETFEAIAKLFPSFVVSWIGVPVFGAESKRCLYVCRGRDAPRPLVKLLEHLRAPCRRPLFFVRACRRRSCSSFFEA